MNYYNKPYKIQAEISNIITEQLVNTYLTRDKYQLN